MAKRWTFDDDAFLHAYSEVGLDLIGPHDLKRSAKACKARIALLKETGAWEAITQRDLWMKKYRIAVGESVEHWGDINENDAVSLPA